MTKAPIRNQSDFIESASVTALMRSLLSNESNFLKNPDYLVKYFVTEKWGIFLEDIENSKKILSDRVPGCMNYHLVRTKQFDEFLLNWTKKNNCGQIILLGAGLDSRSIRFHQNLSNFDIYELDLYSMLEYKQNIIKKNNFLCKSNFVPINFGVDNILDIFKKNNIKSNQPTFILWEGVTYFLEENTVKEILADFNSFFEEELTITFDYAYKDYIDGNLNFFGAKELNRELQNIGEPHIFGIDPNDVNSFVNNLNYVIYEHFTANDLENKFLNNSFNIHGFHGILNLVKIGFFIKFNYNYLYFNKVYL